ncbi:MAG TPA: serine hydrolase [Propionibacteriaceae bacterium]
MDVRGWRLMLVVVLSLAALTSCSRMEAPRPNKPSTDYQALQQAIENRITTGSAALDNVRSVLVSVDGETRVSHYRHGFTAADTTHVRSVTKSVVSTLVGIAASEGLIDSLDQPLAELLPKHRRAMPPEVATVTLRQLMTMSAGFSGDPPPGPTRRLFASHGDLVAYLLRECHSTAGQGQFAYSNVSSHLVAAVLADALERRDEGRPRSVLDYAREKLFDPLGIVSRPAFTEPVYDDSVKFDRARFGWSTDPVGISMGAFGLRLTTADLLKLGQVHLDDGVWQGRQVVPAEWVRQATTASAAEPQYGLMWWLHNWNGHQVYAARGSEGHLVVVVPDQRLVTAISSANHQEFVMDEEALFPLLTEVVMPAVQGS